MSSQSQARTPYLDVVAISSNHLSAGSKQSKRSDHSKLLIEPIDIPGLQHTGLKTTLTGGKSPTLFYANGRKTACFQENVRSYLGQISPERGDVDLDVTSEIGTSSVGKKASVWNFEETVCEMDATACRAAAQKVKARELGSPVRKRNASRTGHRFKARASDSDRLLDSQTGSLLKASGFLHIER